MSNTKAKHAKQLMNTLKENYEISEDWEGEKYIGLIFDWDYEGGDAHLHARICREGIETISA